MVYLHWEVNSGRSYVNNKTSVKKQLLPFVLSQLKQTKSFFHFQQEIFCLLFLKELSKKGFRKYRHISFTGYIHYVTPNTSNLM